MKRILKRLIIAGVTVVTTTLAVSGRDLTVAADSSAFDGDRVELEMVESVDTVAVDSVSLDEPQPVMTAAQMQSRLDSLWASDPKYYGRPTLYDYPYSRTRSMPMWNRLLVNTSVLVGGGITTMLVLEALPDDVTAWNRYEDKKVSMWKRWVRNVKQGPVWDGDNPVFNYILHPYAGAAYYMGARSCGFNCWGSFLYSFCISTFFWEYGFESFNEIPSVQDLIITPVVGSLVGEGFYLAKRKIVENGYRVLGSKVLGYICAFFVDPMNEVVGYFRGDQKKQLRRQGSAASFDSGLWLSPTSKGMVGGISLKFNF